MPSASQSPVKRPSMVERTSSAHSLSSSGKQNTTHKAYRSHTVTRHSRNVSHGKNLSKLNKVNSSANVVGEAKSHQRKKSGGTTPSTSPKGSSDGHVKRNSSQVLLSKNNSHGNLRKNHSANALAIARNVSHPALKKIGLAPAPNPKAPEKKHGFFELGDQSSDGEDEGEWEDSATQSPEFTRNNSKTSTPARLATPNSERIPQRPQESETSYRGRTSSSPPSPALKNNNRSAPNLRADAETSPQQTVSDHLPLQSDARSSRAPPAMSTVSALARHSNLTRNGSSKSFTHISQSEAASMNNTPATSGGFTSSLGDKGISQFLPSNTPSMYGTSRTLVDDDSDYDSPSNFMSHYKPQLSESPEKPRTLNNKARMSHLPSRTQQKLELQRRETMRAGAGAPTTPPASSMGLNMGSSASLHSHSGSRGRNRSLAGDIKTIKNDYDSAVKQLTVVRRFRNPVLESLNRLKDGNILPADVGVATPAGPISRSRPPSRRGPPTGPSLNGTSKLAVSRSFEDKKPSPLASRSNSGARGGRVHFRRQGSHDDIGVTPSQASPGGGNDEEQEGISSEEALLRRIWESREIYEPAESVMAH